MQRRAVGEVHEARGPHLLGGVRVLGLAPVQHREHLRPHAQRLEVGDGTLADPVGVLEGRGGGEHEHVVAARGLDERRVEAAAPVVPFAAPDQGEGASRHRSASLRESRSAHWRSCCAASGAAPTARMAR